MWRRFLSIFFILLTAWVLVPTPAPAAVVHHHRRYYSYSRHRRHVRTAKRVGIGAAGGAVVGAIAGGGTGAGIGALAGGAGGYLYDRYKRHHHRRD
jgi:uncharacterized membrane protein